MNLLTQNSDFRKTGIFGWTIQKQYCKHYEQN
jgi:hypothetical protein